MSRIGESIVSRYEHWILGSMLVLLHGSMWWGFGSALSRSLLLAHLGLFLLWQPIWRTDERLDLRGAVVFCFFTIGFLAWLSWWLMFCWLILLIGLVGGRFLITRNERYIYMATLAFLVSELLIRIVTQLFQVTGLHPDVVTFFEYGLLLVALAVCLVPVDARAVRQRRTVDFFRGVIVALTSALVAVGSLLNMYRTGTEYPTALFQSLLSLGVFLFLLSWLLAPRLGFGGLAQVWERSLLNIGTPFEQWLTELAELAEQQRTPQQFLEKAVDALADLPWIAGVRWVAGEGQGENGQHTAHRIELATGDVEVTIHARRPIGETLLLHSKLLIQLLGHFYAAKLREQELAQTSHLHAIYETGARVTHDIKNLLQSLQMLTHAIVEDGAPGASRRSDGLQLFQRQLPHIVQRLQLALDKLQAPDRSAADQQPVETWWEAAKARHAAPGVDFDCQLDGSYPIPAELFDNVVENLLENTRTKRQINPTVRVRVELHSGDRGVQLRVSDTGAALEEDKARRLFKGPLASDTGHGIGLYQAARLAEQSGYALRLVENDPGNVCFELAWRGDTGSVSAPQHSHTG